MDSAAIRRTWLDRALGAVGLSRSLPPLPAAAPAKRGGRSRVYHAAVVDRLTADLFAANLSANDDLKGDLARLRGLSRRLSRDTALGRRFPKLMAEQTLGPMGIRLQARVEKRLGGRNRGLNAQLERHWKRWGQKEYCTADGSVSWCGLLELAVETLAKDGEFLARHIRGADNPYRYAIEPLDADHLDHEFNGRTAAGNEIIMGVEVNRFGRPVAYWLWTQHPSELTGVRDRVRVPASDIIHLFVAERPKQRRGVPFASAILTDATTLAAFLEASVHAARIGASRMAAIERDKDAPGFDEDDESVGSNIPDEVSPGQMLDLAPGERLTSIDWQYPTGEIDPFVRIHHRNMAAGVNVSYGSLTGDLTGANYSSMRYGLLFERDGYKRLQRLLIESLCWPVYREWLDMAVLERHLPARVDMADYEEVRWQPRGYPWIDPTKDIDAQVTALEHNLTTRRRILGEQGEDLEEIAEELVEEAKLFEELGLATTPPVKPGRAPAAAPAAAATQAAATEDDPTDDEDDDGSSATAAGARAAVRRIA